MTWLEGFAKFTKPQANFLFHSMEPNTCLLRANPEDWRLLLLDGHGSHKSIEFIRQCLNHKVHDRLDVLNIY
jgi:hypothetical protein